MATLKPCRQCEHKVALDAETCPQCGTSLPAAGEGMLAFRGILMVLALGALVYAGYSLMQIAW